MDKISKEKRSEIMSKIHSKNTRLEVDFRKQIWSRGLRYRLHYKIPGKPDFVFISQKISVFVDSCFWHRCPKHFRMPKSNQDYWIPKINRNVKHDREINALLKKEGWRVLRFWEHEINKNAEGCIDRIMNAFNSKKC